MRTLAMAFFVTFGLVGSVAAESTEASNQSAVCIYNGKAYSLNAIICITKSMHQQCINKGGVVGWKDGSTNPIGCQDSWPDTAR